MEFISLYILLPIRGRSLLWIRLYGLGTVNLRILCKTPAITCTGPNIEPTEILDYLFSAKKGPYVTDKIYGLCTCIQKKSDPGIDMR